MRKAFKVALCLAAISLLTSFSHGGEITAVVQSIKGKAKIFSDEGKASKLHVGDVLKSGTSIETDGKAAVDLAFGQNGPVIRLEDNTVLKIVKLVTDNVEPSKTATIVALELGSIKGHSISTAPGSLFIVRTPEIEIKVTGNEFSASAWGEIQVVKGSAEITIGKDKIQIAEGHQFDAGTKEVGPILAQK